jgi:hypothetical protein
MDRGAAEACHPAALAADDDGEENDYFAGEADEFAGSVVLDFAGDEGNRASYAGQEKRAKFPTSKAPLSAVFHSF